MSTFDYLSDPILIESESFRLIRESINLKHLSDKQEQVAMRVVHSMGLPEVAQYIRFSGQACDSGLQAIANNAAILCDVEMVKQGITKRLIQSEPRCYLNHTDVPTLAKQHGETRSMAALRLWQKQLASSIVLIGNAPTALFRLMEMLQQRAAKPALIIAFPVGFVGAVESKQALWELHKDLGVECITLLGRLGGSAATVAVLNALLRWHHGLVVAA